MQKRLLLAEGIYVLHLSVALTGCGDRGSGPFQGASRQGFLEEGAVNDLCAQLATVGEFQKGLVNYGESVGIKSLVARKWPVEAVGQPQRF